VARPCTSRSRPTASPNLVPPRLASDSRSPAVALKIDETSLHGQDSALILGASGRTGVRGCWRWARANVVDDLEALTYANFTATRWDGPDLLSVHDRRRY